VDRRNRAGRQRQGRALRADQLARVGLRIPAV